MGEHAAPRPATTTPERGGAPSRSPEARGSGAIAFFGTWMIFGLFLDGWAHSANKPETFFSPWHGVLYSGFVASLVWFAWDSRRHDDRGVVVDRLANAGLILFVVGAVGDGVWHEVFGIEVDIEALLSPTHLALMIGGSLMVSAPFRFSVRSLSRAPSLREFLPTLLSATLVTSLVLFFLMYVSAAEPIATADHSAELGEAWGVASVLIRTAVMLGASFIVLRRWRPPMGSFTILFSVPSIALAGLDGFEAIALAAPFIVAGVVADLVVAGDLGGERRDHVFALAVPATLWLGYFAAHAVVWGVHWPAEIWTGAIAFAMLAGLGISLVANDGSGSASFDDGASAEVSAVPVSQVPHRVHG